MNAFDFLHLEPYEENVCLISVSLLRQSLSYKPIVLTLLTFTNKVRKDCRPNGLTVPCLLPFANAQPIPVDGAVDIEVGYVPRST